MWYEDQLQSSLDFKGRKKSTGVPLIRKYNRYGQKRNIPLQIQRFKLKI